MFFIEVYKKVALQSLHIDKEIHSFLWFKYFELDTFVIHMFNEVVVVDLNIEIIEKKKNKKSQQSNLRDKLNTLK